MKFKISKSTFLEGLKTVQSVVTNKGALPVLQNVLIEGEGSLLKMTTTDLDLSISAVCDCTVIDAGATTLPVKLLFNIISKMADGEVEVNVNDEDVAQIKAGSSRIKLTGMEAESFPKLPPEENLFNYQIAQATLREMLRKVSYAVAQDDTRKTLKGVLMSFKNSNLTMVATDGRRLAMVENEIEIPQDSEKDFVLPSKLVYELQRILVGEEDISIIHRKSQVCFKIGKVNIYSKLIDDVYPNYHQVIPAETKEKIAVDRQLLLDAIERASVMTMEENRSIKLIFKSGILTVTSLASNIGESSDEVPIKYAGEDIEIVFNPNYIMDPLKAIDDDEVTINLNNGHSPAVIKCSIPFLYVLMPLRVTN